MLENSYEKSIDNDQKDEKSLSSEGEIKFQNESLDLTMQLTNEERKALRPLNNTCDLSMTLSAAEIEKLKRKSVVFDETAKLYDDPCMSMCMSPVKSNMLDIKKPSSPLKRSPRKTVFYHKDNISVTVNDLILEDPSKTPDENILFDKSSDNDMDITYFWPSEKGKNNYDKENGPPKILFKTEVGHNFDPRWRMTNQKINSDNQGMTRRETCHMSVDIDVDKNDRFQGAVVHQTTEMEIETEDYVRTKTRHEELRIRADGFQSSEQTICQAEDLDGSYGDCKIIEENQVKADDPMEMSNMLTDEGSNIRRSVYPNDDLDISMPCKPVIKGRKSIFPNEDMIEENFVQEAGYLNRQTILPNDTPEESFSVEQKYGKNNNLSRYEVSFKFGPI